MREAPIHGGDMAYIAEAKLGEGVGVIVGTSAEQVKLPTADGQQIVGVTLHAAGAGEHITVRRLGVAKVQTSGAITKGARVMVSTTTGKFKTAAAAAGVRVEVAGTSEETNGSSDDIGYIFLTPGAHFVGA